MNKKNQLSYKQALEELEKIVDEIENGEIDVDLLAEKVKRATFLSQICKSKLKKTQEELDKLLSEIEKEDIKQEETESEPSL
ncbi:MAG TPA: exodeoxyribonuclease VII small subunit [Atribacter sp.]|jgi:exodeoxyribonuclease VII small subunit|uniref:Exodeoxyribonuclease 7 small subunit n=1 Tax=Candidatus Atribacter allofermentans TaxID=1852833 RepID=A0A1V5SJK8_9BACT|nr:exodeoxyribonuclease VII small subunit [Atribacter sp.]MDD3713880.1 exodeoxyribonuclease VII small subunit [Atribacterota bacterium]OQA54423.1 MAG: exodeoxyribonuclease VII small subunit [Candidatus Atribacteria bacterium ADurb.Bin276]HHT09754.1 exodeoxyribonuclease VII small subunit [Candidatus Atribacteria bacterium]MDI9595257.1 exodeoxyribonuclease VII small subunit [Atribacterota bacterium]HQK83901.1 exodeoxyribonuclease VII small subunit [Atribacter sp.]